MTRSQARFRGVRQRHWGSWVSEIRHPSLKTRVWLGTFESAEDAARAYDEAARIMGGPKVRTNFPDQNQHSRRTLLSPSLVSKLRRFSASSSTEPATPPETTVKITTCSAVQPASSRQDSSPIKPAATKKTAATRTKLTTPPARSFTCLRLDPERANLGVWQLGSSSSSSSSDQCAEPSWVMKFQVDPHLIACNDASLNIDIDVPHHRDPHRDHDAKNDDYHRRNGHSRHDDPHRHAGHDQVNDDTLYRRHHRGQQQLDIERCHHDPIDGHRLQPRTCHYQQLHADVIQAHPHHLNIGHQMHADIQSHDHHHAQHLQLINQMQLLADRENEDVIASQMIDELLMMSYSATSSAATCRLPLMAPSPTYSNSSSYDTNNIKGLLSVSSSDQASSSLNCLTGKLNNDNPDLFSQCCHSSSLAFCDSDLYNTF